MLRTYHSPENRGGKRQISTWTNETTFVIPTCRIHTTFSTSSNELLFPFQLHGGAQNGPLENGAGGKWQISTWVKGNKAEHLEDSSRLSVAGSNAGSAPTSAQHSPARSSTSMANKGLNLLDDVVSGSKIRITKADVHLLRQKAT